MTKLDNKTTLAANCIDLHTHSNASDGTMTPTEVVNLAAKSGLLAIALTDHDTVAGVDEAVKCADNLPIEVIPGIELSAGYKDGDIHILGLYIDYKSELLEEMSKNIIEERTWRNQKMVDNLSQAGIDITLDRIYGDNPDTVVTRAHFSRYLISRGIVKDTKEAFDKYLGTHTPYFVKRRYLTPEECVRLILDCGGVPVLAHPIIYNLPAKELEDLVTRLVAAGLKGIEAIYSTYTNQDEDIVRSIAHRHSLIITGGSDFHGSNKPDISIGTGRGNLQVPYSILQEIKQLL